VTGSGLILPGTVRKQVQFSKPICFWFNKDADHIINAPDHKIKPPVGYQRIECVHAHEVETWSSRLRAQETRIREMNDEEFYLYEDKIRSQQIAELKKNLDGCIDIKNRLFIKAAIEHFEGQREKARPVHIKRETYMAVESEEGIAP
jgi:hypothetical protein